MSCPPPRSFWITPPRPGVVDREEQIPYPFGPTHPIVDLAAVEKELLYRLGWAQAAAPIALHDYGQRRAPRRLPAVEIEDKTFPVRQAQRLRRYVGRTTCRSPFPSFLWNTTTCGTPRQNKRATSRLRATFPLTVRTTTVPALFRMYIR